MSERIARAVREEPRRGIGFAVVVAALIAAVLVFVTGLASASGAPPRPRSRRMPRRSPCR